MRPCKPHGKSLLSSEHLKLKTVQDQCGAKHQKFHLFKNYFFAWCNTFFYNGEVLRMIFINSFFVEILLLKPLRILTSSKLFQHFEKSPQRRCSIINIRHLFEVLRNFFKLLFQYSGTHFTSVVHFLQFCHSF